MKGIEQHMGVIDSHKADYITLLPLYYDFEYSNVSFDCQVLHDEYDRSYIINLIAKIGHLPYSSENKQQRQLILKNFSHLMAHNLIVKDRHSYLTFPISTTLAGDINARKVMETILYTLLDVKEVIDIINDTMQYKTIENKPKENK
ncbi:MAG: hypothetical protein P8H03_03760 [Emcibacteraceae bacterium]|nr:hypothetical protein [Emcibacteraceae bacterium]